MWKVTKPTIDFALHHQRCAQVEQDNELRGRLLACGPPISGHVAAYDGHANAATLFQLQPLVAQLATTAELKALYPEKMRQNSAVARDVYLELRHAASICPYCGAIPVKTLDHFLPRNHFPELSICPINLVPCCSDCNREKWTYVAATADRQLLHPYYDDVGQKVWLTANVTYSHGRPTIEFHTLEIPDDIELSARIKFQFEKLKLARMYSVYGTALTDRLKRRLQPILAAGGAAAVQATLLETWNIEIQDAPNSWETVTYRALADSPQYCAGAF